MITGPLDAAGRLTRVAVLAAAAGLAYRAIGVDHRLPLPSPLSVEPQFVNVPGVGNVALYRRGPEGPAPFVLVHSVNAAASAAEMRPLFDELSVSDPVTALDLPGYGRSARRRVVYDVDMMVSAVIAALESVGARSHVVALSLGAEFAARAAIARPHLVASLTLISPTGFRTGASAPPGWLGGLVRAPVVGQALFDLLTSRRSIRYFLAKSFAGEVDEGLESYAYASAHQPNARFAPAAFLSGHLFAPEATTALYPHVTAPSLVLFDRDPYSSFAELTSFVSRHAGWTSRRIPGTWGLPHFDATGETVAAIRRHAEAAIA